MNAEQARIEDNYAHKAPWLKWGPYLSERQWGTVREDYSANGDAWNYTTHDTAQSKAYRWGEEGIAGISDDQQILCMSLALWNGKDAMLKERLFGLINSQGNHGEDVKELYYYLDNTPSHSYMKMLYKYVQEAYPYQLLLDENKRRSRLDPEFELIDTGMLDDNSYFDVFIEYAKNDTEDLLIQYTIHNRGVKDAPIHVLPQLWFRKTWDLGDDTPKPQMLYQGDNSILMRSYALGDYYCYTEGDAEFLFTHNETNNQLLYNVPNATPFVKDGINNRVVHGNAGAVNEKREGTKAAIWHQYTVPALSCITVKLRLCKTKQTKPFENFDNVITQRQKEADEFYATKQLDTTDDDEKLIQRQAWAGMLWSKQFFYYDINKWLNGDAQQPEPPKSRLRGRNRRWKHFVSANIISMPDKWEYPWFASWDLAFHCMAIAPIDPDFAKQQLCLLVSANFIHPSGQLPAYEWDFNDVNPPMHALATIQVYELDKKIKGTGDEEFLEDVFHKLLLNFTWWVNQKDSEGNNIFEGGFLGLDNIGVFNRSAPVPGGGNLEQADGTSWMAMYALNMLHISTELCKYNDVYEHLAIKFVEHFLFIAGSIANMGEDSWGLWDDQDGFYYDLLRKPDNSWDRLRVRTLVGLIPMFAVIVFDDDRWDKLPKLKAHLDWFMLQRPDLVKLVSYWKQSNGDEQHLLSLLRGHRMKLLLRRMLDPNEFLSDFGVRSISKIYEKPFDYWLNGIDFQVKYTPAESETDMFGGNSNWRGPIWMPINYLIIKSLHEFHNYYGDDFRVEYPTGSNQYSSLAEIAALLSKRLKRIFLRDEHGERAVFGGHPKLNHDPHFKDYILYHEYFNGDNGKGLGASHQTGWTGLIALL